MKRIVNYFTKKEWKHKANLYNIKNLKKIKRKIKLTSAYEIWFCVCWFNLTSVSSVFLIFFNIAKIQIRQTMHEHDMKTVKTAPITIGDISNVDSTSIRKIISQKTY